MPLYFKYWSEDVMLTPTRIFWAGLVLALALAKKIKYMLGDHTSRHAKPPRAPLRLRGRSLS